jgi:hypothetical protein
MYLTDGKGSATYTVPAKTKMLYLVVQGAPKNYRQCPWDEKEETDMQCPYRVKIDGTDLYGKFSIDTSKNARMRKMRDTLLDCIMGNYEKAAKDNDATLIVEQNGDIKTVSMMARKQLPTGYARIILDYNKKGLPVRMVLDEFAGIETEYTFKY